MFQQTNSCIVVQNIFLGSFKSFLSIVLAKVLGPTEKSESLRYVYNPDLASQSIVRLCRKTHRCQSSASLAFWVCLWYAYKRNVKYIYQLQVSDLINIRVRSLNFRVVSEVKMCIK